MDFEIHSIFHEVNSYVHFISSTKSHNLQKNFFQKNILLPAFQARLDSSSSEK